jgi:hypothetical protein
MKTRNRVSGMLLVAAMFTAAILAAATAGCAARTKKDGPVGNSYNSQVRRIDDTMLRITTRKKVSGDLEEVNKPGTTMYDALVAVQNGAAVRAAIEAKNLGYDVFQVLGSNNLTQVREKRNASADMGDGLSESAFTFAKGHYKDDIELAIELTVKLIPGRMPENPPQDYADVNAILAQSGVADMDAGKK